MNTLMLFITYLGTHSTTIIATGLLVWAQTGNTMPDLGTPSFFKVWAHDLFKALTASTKKK